jgi:hypothetical protein
METRKVIYQKLSVESLIIHVKYVEPEQALMERYILRRQDLSPDLEKAFKQLDLLLSKEEYLPVKSFFGALEVKKAQVLKD